MLILPGKVSLAYSKSVVRFYIFVENYTFSLPQFDGSLSVQFGWATLGNVSYANMTQTMELERKYHSLINCKDMNHENFQRMLALRTCAKEILFCSPLTFSSLTKDAIVS
jgi:hypothetical protein